jgi:hypothetical protein
MHPEIEKFWEEIGEIDFTLSAPIQHYVVEPKGLDNYIVIAEVWNGGSQDGPKQPTKYFYKNTTYTEIEMLRLIRQKAFL